MASPQYCSKIKDPKLIFRVLFTLILAICCFFQVQQSVEKYLAENKSIYSYKRMQNSGRFPVVTICPKLFKNPLVII